MAVKIFIKTKSKPEGTWVDVSGTPDLSNYEKVLTAGTNIDIDRTDPEHPIISATGNVTQEELETGLNKKIDLLGNEEGSGEPYHFPFNVTDLKYENGYLSLVLDTITLDNEKTIVQYFKSVELPRFSKLFDVHQNGTSVFDESTGIANVVTNDLAKQTAVEQVASDLASETSRASEQEGQISSALTNETSARTTADEGLQTQINSLAGAITIKVVETRPETGVNNTIYFVGTETPYTMQLYTDNTWYVIGSTTVDLQDYVKKEGSTLTGSLKFSKDGNGIKSVDETNIININGTILTIGDATTDKNLENIDLRAKDDVASIHVGNSGGEGFVNIVGGKEITFETEELKAFKDHAEYNLMLSETVKNVVTLTKAEYEALETKDANTLYCVED